MLALIALISGPILHANPSHSRTGAIPGLSTIELRCDGCIDVSLESSSGANLASPTRFDWFSVSWSGSRSSFSQETTLGMFQLSCFTSLRCPLFN